MTHKPWQSKSAYYFHLLAPSSLKLTPSTSYINVFFSVDDDKDYRFYDTVDVEDPDHVNSTDIPHIDLTQSEKKLKADLTKQLFAQTGRSSKKQHFARSYIYYLQNLMKQAENAILKAETMIPALDES